MTSKLLFLSPSPAFLSSSRLSSREDSIAGVFQSASITNRSRIFPSLPNLPPLTLKKTATDMKKKSSVRGLMVRSQFNAPIISPLDQWGNWTTLFAIGAFGLWAEKKTKIGSALSGALVSTLVGLAASNLGLMSSEAPAFLIVLEYLLPAAVPLLLYRADMRRVIKSTGALLLAFLLGSVATTVGTVLAYLMVPMRSLGQDSWKIAAALMGRHIGGD